MKKTILFMLVFSIIMVNPYCVFSKDKINITVSIPPIADIVRNIGGESVIINTLIEPGEDAHSFDPKPSEIISFSKSDIYFISNIEFEYNLIDKIKSIKPDIQIFDTGQNIKKIITEHKCSSRKSHEKHKYLIEDIHIWNSFENIVVMATNISDILCEKSPKNSENFKTNLKEYKKKINIIIEEMNARREQLKSKQFMVFHPSWSYFARDYNLEQIAVEVDEKEPGPKDLKELIDSGIKNKIRTIIISPNFGSVAPGIIAKAIGAELKEINPIPENILKELVKLSGIILK